MTGAVATDPAGDVRVLALLPDAHDTTPGQRFRIEQWEPLLGSEGVVLDRRPFADERLAGLLRRPGGLAAKCAFVVGATARRLNVARSYSDYDAVYVFREAALLGPPLVEWWLGRAGIPMIFDFDDAVFLPYQSPTNGKLSVLKFPGLTTRTACSVASHVIAGNRFLAEYAARYNSQVSIVPTTIDTAKYLPRPPKPPSSELVIGWSGSHSTVRHLDLLRRALQRLADVEPFRLRVVGADDYRLDGVEVEAMPWSSRHELEQLGEIDIGVMPLPDESWSLGKCGLKALQYMALGIPTVCSPVGVNSEIIRDDDNGLLAASDDQWVDRLARLLRSPELRLRLGAAGRRTVETEYSAAVQAPRVAEIFRSVARRGGPGAREAATASRDRE